MSANEKFYCARIYVTHKCNSNCSFCDTHDKIYKDIHEMNLEQAITLIQQLREIGVKYLDLTGGEPTLNVNLPEIISFANNLGIKTEVTSNVTAGLTDTLVKSAACARKFNISLDTLNSEKYKKIRGVDKLKIVLSTIKKIAKIRAELNLIVPKLMTVVTEENLEDVPDLIDFAAKNSLEIYLNPVFSYGQMNFNLSEKLFEKLLSFTFKKNVIIPIHFLEMLRDLRQNKKNPCRCGATEQILTFAADGRIILPCYHARERILLPSPNIREFLDGEEFKNYAKQKGTLPSCVNCAVSPYFGISFSFRPDKYFILQSFSDRLEHVKRDFLNKLQFAEQPELLSSLKEFLTRLRALPPCQESVADCWSLKNMPHQFFDEVYSTVKLLNPKIDSEADFIREIPIFMLKWWNFSTMHQRDLSNDIDWINNYLEKLKRIRKEAPDTIKL